MKQCRKCKEQKQDSELVNFSTRKTTICKACWNEHTRNKWKNNDSYREKEAARKKEWRQNNLEYCRARDLRRYEAQKNDLIKKKAVRERQKKISNPLFHNQCKMRSRFNSWFRGSKNRNIEKIVGCSLIEFKNHLEKQFTQNMNWENYGRKKDCWSIDHKIPISSAKTPQELEKLFHYTNTQPMWLSDNIKKSSK